VSGAGVGYALPMSVAAPAPVTAIVALASLVSSEAGTVAVSWVDFTRVVVNAVVVVPTFHVTCEVPLKLEPFTVSVKLLQPSGMLVGLKLVTAATAEPAVK